MIKTLKETTKEIYNWTKDKIVRFKKWIVILIFGAAVVAAPLVLPPNIPDIALEKIQQKYNASELKDKYRLEKTAFILDAIDENAIQAEVGNKNSDSFEPSLTLRKWSDEVNFKVKYKHGEKEKDQKVDIENKKIKFKSDKTEVHYYEAENGYEFEIILLEKPDSNNFLFQIDTFNLDYFYQPELTQEEKDNGAFRPDNVINSYAVYHSTKTNHILGQKNYMSGKAFHIFRPEVCDDNNICIWGDLSINTETGILTITIEQKFIDNAIYPVKF